ncbi:MAG: hypothetical protein V7631_4214 [Massilia sp.]|jgi:hypothetical protein
MIEDERPGALEHATRAMDDLVWTVKPKASPGSVRKVKLARVSPLRMLFIFSGGARQEAFSLPAEKLAQASGSGSVKVLALEGVVGRVLTEAMQAMNDPDSARRHAAG